MLIAAKWLAKIKESPFLSSSFMVGNQMTKKKRLVSYKGEPLNIQL